MHGAARLQRVQHRKRLVHAHGHFFIGLPLAFGQLQMQCAAGRIAPQLRHELAMRRHHGARGHAAHQRFIAAAVLNQIGNRADLQPVLRGEKLQIGQPRHRAVGIHNWCIGIIARLFDAVCEVLTELGYLELVDRGHPERELRVTDAGRVLARVYAECDLLISECLRSGLWEGLESADLATTVSACVYEPRLAAQSLGLPLAPGSRLEEERIDTRARVF